jgi:hypothetical protein
MSKRRLLRLICVKFGLLAINCYFNQDCTNLLLNEEIKQKTHCKAVDLVSGSETFVRLSVMSGCTQNMTVTEYRYHHAI